jgi:thioredoxin-related protein
MNPNMRVLTSFFLVILLIFSSCKNEKTYYLVDDANLVLKKARHDKKLVFLDFYTAWCGGCKEYEKHTFVDTSFKKYLTENFYSSRINAELVQNIKITKKYAISGYPTVVITDSKGEEIDRIIGYKEESIKEFIAQINSIIKGKENMIYLDSIYTASPDSIELFRKIAREKLWYKDDYKNLMKFSESVMNKSRNLDIKKEAHFYYAIGAINDKSNQDPQPLKDLLNSHLLLDSDYLETCNVELLYFYQRINDVDSIDHYHSVLIKFKRPGGHFVYVRDYARFLYENNRKINVANQLTKEYTSFPGFEADHWTPFLLAHSYAKQDSIKKGVEIFDKWMDKYSPPDTKDKSQWPYIFYIDYALYYKVSLNKALEYAKLLEGMNASKDNKKILAELLYLNNKTDLAIEKLKEITAMIETDREKKEIDELMARYMKK